MNGQSTVHCTSQAAPGAGTVDGQALAGAGGVQVADPGVTAALLQLLTAGAGPGGVSDLATPLQVGAMAHPTLQILTNSPPCPTPDAFDYAATSAAVTHLVQALLAPPGRQTQTQVQYKAALAQYHLKQRQQQAAGSGALSTGQLGTPGQSPGAAAAATATLPTPLQQPLQVPSSTTPADVPLTPTAGAQLSIFQRAADLAMPVTLPACSDQSDAGATAAGTATCASSGSKPADGLGLVSMAYGSDGSSNGGSGVMGAPSGDLEHDTPGSAAGAAAAAPAALAAVLAAGGVITTPPASPAPSPGTTAAATAETAAAAGSGHGSAAAAMLHLPCGENSTPHAAADTGGDGHAPEAEEAAPGTHVPVPISNMPATSHLAAGNPADDASAPAAMEVDGGGSTAEACEPAHGGRSGDSELPVTAAPADPTGGSGAEAPGGGGETADGVPAAVDGAALPPPSTPAGAGLTMPDPQPQPLAEPHTADSEAAADVQSQPVPASKTPAAALEPTEAATANPFQQLVMGTTVEDSGPAAHVPDVAAAFACGDRKKLLRMLLDLPLGPSPREVISIPMPALYSPMRCM